MTDRKERPLPPFTFSASVSRLLRPISGKMKRVGKLKVSPRVHGKIMETDGGGRILIIEKKGKDIWRGRHRSLNDAIKAGDAAIGLDRVLLKRATNKHGVVTVMFVVEDLGKVFIAPADMFYDEEKSGTKTHWDGAAHRVVFYQHFREIYLGPNLKSRRGRSKSQLAVSENQR